jgi:hypothetical protein
VLLILLLICFERYTSYADGKTEGGWTLSAGCRMAAQIFAQKKKNKTSVGSYTGPDQTCAGITGADPAVLRQGTRWLEISRDELLKVAPSVKLTLELR